MTKAMPTPIVMGVLAAVAAVLAAIDGWDVSVSSRHRRHLKLKVRTRLCIHPLDGSATGRLLCDECCASLERSHSPAHSVALMNGTGWGVGVAVVVICW